MYCGSALLSNGGMPQSTDSVLTPTGLEYERPTGNDAERMNEQESRSNYHCGKLFVVQGTTGIPTPTLRGRSMVLQEPRRIELGVDQCPGLAGS
jgi:hypothetical protein